MLFRSPKYRADVQTLRQWACGGAGASTNQENSTRACWRQNAPTRAGVGFCPSRQRSYQSLRQLVRRSVRGCANTSSPALRPCLARPPMNILGHHAVRGSKRPCSQHVLYRRTLARRVGRTPPTTGIIF